MVCTTIPLALAALLALPCLARPRPDTLYDLTPLNSSTPNRRVIEWTAMGDSYAAGIGVGNSINTYCLRYDGGYASILDRQLQTTPPIMNFTACSGDTVADVSNSQFIDTKPYLRDAEWGNKPEFVTINLAGNDIGFKELVTRCVYGIIYFTLFRSCDEVIRSSQAAVADPELGTKIFNVIVKALVKAQSKQIDNFGVYVLGYAQFFNENREQCNNVRGLPAPRYLVQAQPSLLTTDLRRKLNGIAKSLNTVIQNAVRRASTTYPNQVFYVPMDDLFNGHRFCDHDEPNARNPDTWFITYDQNRAVSNAGQRFFNSIPQIRAISSNSSNAEALSPGQFINITTAALQNSTSSNFSSSLEARSLVDLVDVFHPKSAGHQEIANRLQSFILPPLDTVEPV